LFLYNLTIQSIFNNIYNDNSFLIYSELRKALYYLFSQYGRVVDVVALKTMKMRGQAFIVYREITEATKAMRSLQGFPLFDKPIVNNLDFYL